VENRTQLKQAETTYQELTRAREVSINAAKAKIEGLRGAIQDLRMKQAMAEMNEMASGMISQIGGSGDTLNRLHEMVEEERTQAAGRARVAKDSLNLGDINVQEAEQKALADLALADFAAKEGMILDRPAGTAAEAPAATGPVKQMGPAQVG
jgi:hypothetical protein